jgi:putative addiction module component (TIGR02574 family)
MDFLSLEREALALPVDERARLARDLLARLESLSVLELEILWRAEASNRAKELSSGEVKGVSAEDVYREAEALFR